MILLRDFASALLRTFGFVTVCSANSPHDLPRTHADDAGNIADNVTRS
jgi:hypothetical protein